jgi:hypothetical protein
MKSNFSSFNFPGIKQKSKEEIKEEICKHHKIGSYYGCLSYSYSINGAAKELHHTFTTTVREKLESHAYATVNYSGEKAKIKYNVNDYKSKIYKTPYVFDKTNEFTKFIENYQNELKNFQNQMVNASSMKEADNIHDEMGKYHSSTSKSLYSEIRNVVKDFGVTLSGIVPDVNEGYESP